MIAVVSHDAGGAEVLSSYVRWHGPDCCFVLEGPALNIFERKLGALQPFPLEEALQRADSILCGSSWPSDLEWRSIKRARSLGKRSIVFLEHWMNYGARFVRGGETCLPDEFWVSDHAAEKMVRELFPGVKVVLVENPYFQDLERELAQVPSLRKPGSTQLAVLYVCEPKRVHGLSCYGDERHWGYVEEEALRYFLRNLSALGKPIERIVIRPHPSEPSEKYDWAKSEFNLPISRGGDKPLFTEVAESDVVVGCESMALVIGLLAGKRVICSIPPGGKKSVLPQPEIESLQSLLKS